MTEIRSYAFKGCTHLAVIIDNEKEEERNLLIARLPEELKHKVITKNWANEVFRLNKDGSKDNTFNFSHAANGTVHCITSLSDKIYCIRNTL